MYRRRRDLRNSEIGTPVLQVYNSQEKWVWVGTSNDECHLRENYSVTSVVGELNDIVKWVFYFLYFLSKLPSAFANLILPTVTTQSIAIGEQREVGRYANVIEIQWFTATAVPNCSAWQYELVDLELTKTRTLPKPLTVESGRLRCWASSDTVYKMGASTTNAS